MLNVLLFCSDSGEPICVAQNHWDALALNERIEWRCHHRERAREEKCKTKQMKENRKRKEIGENVRRRYAINNKIDLLPFFSCLGFVLLQKITRTKCVCECTECTVCALQIRWTHRCRCLPTASIHCLSRCVFISLSLVRAATSHFAIF